MVRVLTLLSLLFAFAAQAAVVPGGIPNIGLGSVNQSGLPQNGPGLSVSDIGSIYGSTVTTGWFTLHAGGQPGSNNFNPFYRNGVAYQVTNGYTCKCVHIVYTVNTANCSFQLVSDTTSVPNADTALTAGVYQYGATSVYGMRNAAADAFLSRAIQYNFTSQTYPAFQSGCNASYDISMLCKEVAN